MKLLVKNAALLGLILFLCISLNAQTIENSGDAAKRLRELYQLRAFDDGIAEGGRLVAEFPGNSEIYAWLIAHKSRTVDSDTLDKVREFATKNEDDLWANFALVTVLSVWEKTAEALEKTEKFAASENEDFILARAKALARKGKTAEALKFLDEKAVFIADKSRLETAKGEVFYFSENDGDKEKAFAAFETAQKLNPNNLDAFYLAGYYLSREKRFDEAIDPLQKAVKISPSSYYVRQPLWTAMFSGRAKKSKKRKQKEIAADIERFRKMYPDSPKRLMQISTSYGRMELPQKKKAYEEILLKNFNDSAEAERVLMNRIFSFSYYDQEKKQIDEAKLKQYSAMLAAFLKRPRFYSEVYQGAAYANYLYTVKEDKTVSDAEYLRLGAEAVKYQTFDITLPFPMLVDGLIKRGKYEEAEKYARLGMETIEKRFKAEDEKQAEFKSSEFQRNDARKQMNALLGDVFFKRKNYAEAEKYFLISVGYGKQYNHAVVLLGELYEETGDFDKAEKYYVEAVALSDADEPDYGKLKSLYEKQNKTADGFDKYLEKIKPLEKQVRREYVVSQKNKEPLNLTAFDLKLPDGKLFSSADLKGKVVVINIWATWCGPCIKELPEFQELHKKYQADKGVAIITINSQEDAATINKFMIDKKYDFPVVMSEEYTKDVNAIPTTWFVDRNGQIIYTKVGYTKNLVEEFDWRIEELRKN